MFKHEQHYNNLIKIMIWHNRFDHYFIILSKLHKSIDNNNINNNNNNNIYNKHKYQANKIFFY
jgi:hypothetical protein